MKKLYAITLMLSLMSLSFLSCSISNGTASTDTLVSSNSVSTNDYIPSRTNDNTPNISKEYESDSTEDYHRDNGIAKPTTLKLVASNFKTAMTDDADYKIDVENLHMITDEYGYNYLVLNYSFTNLNQTVKKDPPIIFEYAMQNGIKLDSCFYSDLSEECKENYADKFMSTKIAMSSVRPNETKYATAFFEIYDIESDVVIQIDYGMQMVADGARDEGIIRQFSFK